MDLLLNILNKSGYIIDNENLQIIDYSNNETGKIFCDKDLIIYSFSDGRKIIFDKANNQVTIHISNDLDILYKSVNDTKDNNIYIDLNMKLSNGTESCLEYYLKQTDFCLDYEVIFNHKDLDGYKSILFSKYSHNPNAILYAYENGLLEYTGLLNPNSYNVEGVSQAITYSYLKPLIRDSGLIDSNDIIEINNIMTKGINIVNSSVNELTNFFLSYDFSKEKETPCEKIKLLDNQKN